MKTKEINFTNHIYDMIDHLAEDLEKDFNDVLLGVILYSNDKVFDEEHPDEIIFLEGYISGASRFLRKEMGEIYEEK